jgi:peptide chain release factor subunit 3
MEQLGIEDKRESLNIVFIGHVDAGKSTICGQLLFLSGQVDRRTMEKYEREAKENNRSTWVFAYIMDTVEEERARGKTIDVGRTHFDTTKKRYTILDAPGHKNYIPNMISGIVQADVAILIISAKTGEFESGFEKGGQTREHAFLARTVGIRQLVIAINKMDDVDWSQERYEMITKTLTPFLYRDCGYSRDCIYFVPISGYLGINMLSGVGVPSWYKGETLMGILDNLKPLDRSYDAPLRMSISDKFKDMGVMHAIGRIESGTVCKGQSIVIMPSKHESKVIGVFEREDNEVKESRCGENVRLTINNSEENVLAVGDIICDVTKDKPVNVICEFEAQLAIIDMPASNPLFTAGYTAVIHICAAVRECTVVELIAEIDKKTRMAGKRKPVFVKSGYVVVARLTLTEPVCAELFAEFPQLGRFIMRDKGKTIAIGKITKIIN